MYGVTCHGAKLVTQLEKGYGFSSASSFAALGALAKGLLFIIVTRQPIQARKNGGGSSSSSGKAVGGMKAKLSRK